MCLISIIYRTLPKMTTLQVAPTYVSFEPAKSGTSDRFIDDLRTCTEIEPNVSHLISAVEKGDLKVSSFSPVGTTYSEQYICMFVGYNDSVLEKLGRDYEINRGFPVKWIPGKEIRFYGFRIKFSNNSHIVFRSH